MEDIKIARQIQRNVRAHDRVARRYEKRHGEIYNPREQARLREALAASVREVQTGTTRPRALDFGCGAGNLTAHLLDLGCDVVATDVSQACLDLVGSRHQERNVSTVLLNGSDLSNVAEESMDMVATYSVLHHVPDYLGVLPEFVRVLKPGGVLFIDHEVSDVHWRPDDAHLQFKKAMVGAKPASRFGKYLSPQNYINWFMCRFVDPRYSPEGDIHVFPDDHIEWPKIIAVLEGHGMGIVRHDRYLLFRDGYDPVIYDAFSSRTHDMEMLVARKAIHVASG